MKRKTNVYLISVTKIICFLLVLKKHKSPAVHKKVIVTFCETFIILRLLRKSVAIQRSVKEKKCLCIYVIKVEKDQMVRNLHFNQLLSYLVI